ncbi:uncharacterized protein C8Q71DRAFT_771253 [Rhodofomes roseus]|uniref:Uncharacterized protein n=1 Tax=Rhodofomes roseus TaxID=34475 RepID=A0ABQ8K9R4_9APHY|nr:uncharacterized protein C8Q71DRAFT_771253 [Rhodofomes roseus]KAH9834122.1 hypothetical protein C8Q71DRAFT_771253 [Rhodofomes roseus]
MPRRVTIGNIDSLLGIFRYCARNGFAVWQYFLGPSAQLQRARSILENVGAFLMSLSDQDKENINKYVAEVSEQNPHELACILETEQMFAELVGAQQQHEQLSLHLAANPRLRFPWSDLAKAIFALVNSCLELQARVEVIPLISFPPLPLVSTIFSHARSQTSAARARERYPLKDNATGDSVRHTSHGSLRHSGTMTSMHSAYFQGPPQHGAPMTVQYGTGSSRPGASPARSFGSGPYQASNESTVYPASDPSDLTHWLSSSSSHSAHSAHRGQYTTSPFGSETSQSSHAMIPGGSTRLREYSSSSGDCTSPESWNVSSNSRWSA